MVGSWVGRCGLKLGREVELESVYGGWVGK